ncbi:hypothetical protein B0H10DRAFT_2432620 [Mycena sp. CBHHK59/15]|nr:hypothetical protein B0H10DRAFT_2432620 [Mycena sp. CBHHK59/15]
MADSSQHQPFSIDLLQNRNYLAPLGPFDGAVAALAQIGAEHYFITTHANYVPTLPPLHNPHRLYLREDMHYGTDDYTRWPQQFTVKCAVVDPKAAGLLTLREKSLALAISSFWHIIQQILEFYGQLQTLPTTFPKMLFTVASMQSAVLELDALDRYMTIHKAQIEQFLAPQPMTVGHFVGVFTSDPSVVQKLWAAGCPCWFLRPQYVFDEENILRVVPLREPPIDLYDPDAHADAAREVPWYRDPFETGACASLPNADAVVVPGPPIASGSTSAVRSDGQTHHAKPYSDQNPKEALQGHADQREEQREKQRENVVETIAPVAPHIPGPIERDRFARLDSPYMPPPIVAWADALAAVDRTVAPSVNDPADGRYVLPKPALLVYGTTPARRRMFLHRWNLLGDCFMWMLQHNAQLLSTQDWKDVLEGLVTPRSHPDSKAYKRGAKLQQCLRPALDTCNITSLEGILPVAQESCPKLSVAEMHGIVWQVAETSFRFEFCALDRRASGLEWLDVVKQCFAGSMLMGVPLHFGPLGWAADKLEEHHRYAHRTAQLMFGWKTKARPPMILERANLRVSWSAEEMESLEQAVCRYYTQAFWELFDTTFPTPSWGENLTGTYPTWPNANVTQAQTSSFATPEYSAMQSDMLMMLPDTQMPGPAPGLPLDPAADDLVSFLGLDLDSAFADLRPGTDVAYSFDEPSVPSGSTTATTTTTCLPCSFIDPTSATSSHCGAEGAAFESGWARAE